MIRELIDTDLEVVAGGYSPVNVNSFNPFTNITSLTGIQSAVQSNSANLTGVAIGGSVLQATGPQSNSLNQTQAFVG